MLSLLIIIIAIATFPRLYTYPKAFVYPAAMWALLCYQRRPDRRSFALVAFMTAVAFLFRHDHGVWMVGPTVLGVAFPLRKSGCSPGGLSLTAWRASRWSRHGSCRSACPGTPVNIGASWWSGPTASRTGPDFRFRIFEFDFAAPIVSIAPVESPVVGIRWAPEVPAEQRSALEDKYQLLALAGDSDRYRLRNLDRDNIRALLMDPAIDDTSGIDRSSARTPDGAFPWLYLQLQRYIAPVRLRVFPGFVKTMNAEPWLTDVTFFVPWFVLVVELLRGLTVETGRRRGGRYRDPCGVVVDRDVSDARSCVAGLPPGRHRCADGRPARMGHLAGVDHRRRHPCHREAIGGRRDAAHDCERADVRPQIPRVGGVGVDGPTNFARRLSGVGGLYATRPLDLYAPPGATGLAGLSRWLNECTSETARVALIGFEPQVFVLSERGFAGGLAFYDLGWNSSEEDQALVIERWSRQEVPVVLAMESEWGSFSRETIPRFAAGSMRTTRQ